MLVPCPSYCAWVAPPAAEACGVLSASSASGGVSAPTQRRRIAWSGVPCAGLRDCTYTRRDCSFRIV